MKNLNVKIIKLPSLAKVVFLIILSFILITGRGFSQGIRFGFFANPQISWLKPDIKEVTNEGSRSGINIGISMNSYFTNNYAFSTGISINRLGGKISYEDSTALQLTNRIDTLYPGNILTCKMQYITIPLGLKFKSDEIGYFTFFAKAGIDPMINISATGLTTDKIIDSESISDEINLFNLGYHLEIGIQYSLGGQTALQFGLNYQNGILDITTDGENQLADKIILNSVSMHCGIIF